MTLTPFGLSGMTGQEIVLVSVGLPGMVASALAKGGCIHQLGLADVTHAQVQLLSGAVFACPLMGDTTDAVVVLEALEAAGFGGTLLVIAPPLPNPTMVERELRTAAQKVTLRLVSM